MINLLREIVEVLHSDLSPSSQSLVLKFYFPLKGSWTPWKNGCFQVWFRKGMRGSWWILHQKNKNILKNWKGNVKKTPWKSPICQIWDNLSIKSSSESVTTMNYNWVNSLIKQCVLKFPNMQELYSIALWSEILACMIPILWNLVRLALWTSIMILHIK